MATVISGTTRTNLGPLTTATWTYTCTEVIQACSNCDNGWAAQTCEGGVVTDNQNCWPPRATNVAATGGALAGWGVYSPGILCPSGYTSVAGATYRGSSDFEFQYPLTAGETAIGCCPKGGFMPIQDINKIQTCVQFKPTTSFLVGSCGNGGAVYTPFSIGGTLSTAQYNSFSVSAPFLQAVYQASDMPSQSTSTPTTSTSTSASSSGSSNVPANQSNVPDSPPSSGLSTGATAGIAIGAVLAAILIATAGFCLWRSRRKNRAVELPNQNAWYSDWQPSGYKPFDTVSGGQGGNGGAPQWRYDAAAAPRGAMGVSQGQPIELANPNPTPPVELGPSYSRRDY